MTRNTIDIDAPLMRELADIIGREPLTVDGVHVLRLGMRTYRAPLPLVIPAQRKGGES